MTTSGTQDLPGEGRAPGKGRKQAALGHIYHEKGSKMVVPFIQEALNIF